MAVRRRRDAIKQPGYFQVLRVEIHPYLRQDKLVSFCQENGITLTAYSPLGSPATSAIKPHLISPECSSLLNDPTILEVATRHNVTPAQVLLKWSITRGIPVLVKSSSKTRMQENLDCLRVELTDYDMEAIRQIQYRCRYLTFQYLLQGRELDDYWDGEFFN